MAFLKAAVRWRIERGFSTHRGDDVIFRSGSTFIGVKNNIASNVIRDVVFLPQSTTKIIRSGPDVLWRHA